MRTKLSAVKAELRRRMHLPVPEQGEWLGRVVRGHLAYFALPDNSQALLAFRRETTRHWQHTLRRRSQTWPRDPGTDASPHRPMATPTPHPAPLAQRPLQRQNPRQEPGALNAHAGICAGGRQQWRSLPRP